MERKHDSEEQDSILGIDSVYQEPTVAPQQQPHPAPGYVQLVRLYPVLIAAPDVRPVTRSSSRPPSQAPAIQSVAQASRNDPLATEAESGRQNVQNPSGIGRNIEPVNVREYMATRPARQQRRQVQANTFQESAMGEGSGILAEELADSDVRQTQMAKLTREMIDTVHEARRAKAGRPIGSCRREWRNLTPEQLAQARRIRRAELERRRPRRRGKHTAAELDELRVRNRDKKRESRQLQRMQMQDTKLSELHKQMPIKWRERQTGETRGRSGIPDNGEEGKLSQGMERRRQLYFKIKSGEINKEEADEEITDEVKKAAMILKERMRAQIRSLPQLQHRRKRREDEKSAKPKPLPALPAKSQSRLLLVRPDNLPMTPAPCQLCRKSVPLRYLRLHLRHHDQDGSDQAREEEEEIPRADGAEFKCDACGKIYGEEFLLKMHQRQAHESPAVVNCSICDKEFRDKATVNKHTTKAHASRICTSVSSVCD